MLEAFGNAKTVSNDNSSRYLLHRKVWYNAAGSIARWNTNVVQLEKWRLTSQTPGERSFHAVYYLLATTDPTVRPAPFPAAAPPLMAASCVSKCPWLLDAVC